MTERVDWLLEAEGNKVGTEKDGDRAEEVEQRKGKAAEVHSA